MIPNSNRPNLSNNLDLSFIRIEAQNRLFEFLDKYEGSKTIVWDDKLMGPFDFVAGPKLLIKHEVTRLCRLSDSRSAFASDTDNTLFFMRKDYQVAKFVSDILNRNDKETLSKTSLVLVPQKCASIEKLLEQNRVDLSKLRSIEELPIELFVLDTDILSMENEFVYRDMYLNEDYSAVHQIVEGLMKLQDIYGQIPRISGQGKGAKLVADLLLKRRKLQAPRSQQPSAPQIHQLILIDRKIDLITPFLTQLTYEGLLDEVFGVNHGTITLPTEKFLTEEQKSKASKLPERSKTTKFPLRSSEELYATLRDYHINGVAGALKQSARNLQTEYDECKIEGKTIHEMGKIVKRVSQLEIAKKSQSNHVTIAGMVNEQTLKPEFIYGLRIEHELLQEDRINRIVPDIDLKLLRQEPPLHILRLICLQSVINNGIKSKISDYYKKEIIQNYGDDYLLFLMQLEKADILLSRERYYETGTFSQLKSRFNLINDNIDECNPNHLSYVYGGYSPLSVMVVKTLTQISQGSQWRSQVENLKLLPEPTINHIDPSHQSSGPTAIGGVSLTPNDSSNSLAGSAVAAASLLLSTNAGGGFRVRRNSATSSQSSSEEVKTVLVFFIGGCTFAEISALRFTSQQEENNCEFIIATTKILNGKSFLKSLWPQQNFQSAR